MPIQEVEFLWLNERLVPWRDPAFADFVELVAPEKAAVFRDPAASVASAP